MKPNSDSGIPRSERERRQMDQIKALYAAYKEMRLRLHVIDVELERFRRRIDRAAARLARGG
jgi:hypothetical protein